MDIELSSERADHQRIPAPVRLQRDAPVRRNAAELSGRAEWVRAEIVLRAEAQRLVTRQFEVKQVVDEGIGADASNMRGESALDHRSRVLWTKDIRYSVREAPCRRGVPDVLHGRLVVGGDAVDDIEWAEMSRAGIADIGIVPGPGMAIERIRRGAWPNCVVGHLREGADMVGDRATPERTERREHHIVVRT